MTATLTESYGLVLVLIGATYAMDVSTRARPPGPSLVLLIQIVTVWLALRLSGAGRVVRLIATLILAAAALIVIAGEVTNAALQPAILAASSALYLIAPASIVRHLVSRPAVDRETLVGAVCAYLLVGMFFAFCYRLIGSVQPGPFFGEAGEIVPDTALFFSFTTLTTTGYGNLVPAANPGQTLAVTEMLFGQLFLITAIGKVVAAWSPRRWTSPPSEAPRQD